MAENAEEGTDADKMAMLQRARANCSKGHITTQTHEVGRSFRFQTLNNLFVGN